MVISQLTYFCCRLVRHSAKLSYLLAFFILFGFGNTFANASQCLQFYGLKANKNSEVLDPQFQILNKAFFGLSSRLAARLWNNLDVLRIEDAMEAVTTGALNEFYLDGLGYFGTRARFSKKQFQFELGLVAKEVATGQMEIGDKNSAPDWLYAKTSLAILKVMLRQVKNFPQIESVSMTGGNIENEMLIEMYARNSFKKMGTNYVKSVPIK